MLTDASGKLYPLATGEGEVLPCIRPAWQARPQVDMPRDAKRLQPDLQLATAHRRALWKTFSNGLASFFGTKELLHTRKCAATNGAIQAGPGVFTWRQLFRHRLVNESMTLAQSNVGNVVNAVGDEFLYTCASLG